MSVRFDGQRATARGAAVLGAAAVFGCMAAAGAQAKTEILFNLFAPPKHIINTGIVKPWAAAVTKASSGRVTFKFPPSSVAPPPRQFDIARTGTVDMAYQFNGFLRRRVPLVQLTLLPFMGRSGRAQAVALWRTYKKFFEKKNQYSGVHLVGFFGGPPGDICSLKAQKEINSVAALKTMKMWSLPGPPSQGLKRLNVTVVPGPAVRIYSIVSKGIVDGFAGLGLQEAIRFNVAQFAKSCTVLSDSMFTAMFSLMINPKKWDSLSDADKQAFDKLGGETLAHYTRHWDAADANAPENLRKLGVKVLDAAPAFEADLRKAWQPMHQQWIDGANKLGIDGKAAYDFFRAEVAKAEAAMK